MKIILYLFFSIGGLILMKLGGGEFKINLTNGVFNINLGLKLLIALAMYIISFLFYIGLIAKNDLGFIVPLSSAIVNIAIVVAGILIFKEQMTLYKGIGIMLAIVGVILMNIK